MALTVFAVVFAILDLWSVLSTPTVPVMPDWMRLLLPLTVAAAALREPRGKRSAFVVMAVMFLFAFNADRFGHPVWIHLIVWACCAYLARVGIRGGAPSRMSGKRLGWSLFLVTVVIAAIWFFPPV